jgi:hypothetical protein
VVKLLRTRCWAWLFSPLCVWTILWTVPFGVLLQVTQIQVCSRKCAPGFVHSMKSEINSCEQFVVLCKSVKFALHLVSLTVDIYQLLSWSVCVASCV